MLKTVIKSLCVAVAMSLLFSVGTIKADAVSVSAKGMVLINADTLEVLDSKDEHKKLPMASTTKLMTALIIAENCDLDTEIVTTHEMVAVEGSSMGLLAGDSVSYYALLVGMMLPSGNDAANTAAIAYAGSVSSFSEIMNRKAEQLSMNNTYFVNPSGLPDDEHYSTAYDMALLAAEVLKNDVLSEIVSKSSMTVSYGNPPYKRTLTNHNKLLLQNDTVIGLKTGYTKKAGRCLVSAARKNGCTVIAVTLNDPDDWDDHKKLLTYGLSLLKTKTFGIEESFVPIPVVGSDNDTIQAITPEFVCGVADDEGKITYKIYHEPFLYAPLSQGDTVGHVDYYYNGVFLISMPLKVVESISLRCVEQGAFSKWLTEFFYLFFKCI